MESRSEPGDESLLRKLAPITGIHERKEAMRANRSIRVLRYSFSRGALGARLAVVISLAVSAPVLAETRRAYVWADQPTAAAYAPNPLYVQPGGGEVQIVRSSA